MRRWTLVVPVVLVSVAAARPARAVGEGNGGFPNWQERVIHEWMNRARVDPQVEMTQCGSACADAACYGPMPPLAYAPELNRAARFHSDEMGQQGYFDHNSHCTIVQNISSLYPGSCNGAASCACVGGTETCNPSCTSWSARIQLFGAGPSGEIIASGTDPNSAFYQWLFESYPVQQMPPNCMYDQGPPTNGHRWNILKSQGDVGAGVGSGGAVGDFGGGTSSTGKIPSGSHYPQQAASVDLWANWSDAAAPKTAIVNVGGNCAAMTRARGTDTNGAWTAKVSGVGSGCIRYRFEFEDSGGSSVFYPTTGSLAIGSGASCPDYDAAPPPACGCTPMCAGKSCGDDGCGSTCGSCTGGKSCQAGQCVGGTGTDAGGGSKDAGGSAGDGGGTAGGDASAGPDAGGGAPSGGNGDNGNPPSAGGCGCVAAGAGAGDLAALGATLGALGLALARLRSRAARGRGTRG